MNIVVKSQPVTIIASLDPLFVLSSFVGLRDRLTTIYSNGGILRRELVRHVVVVPVS